MLACTSQYENQDAWCAQTSFFLSPLTDYHAHKQTNKRFTFLPDGKKIEVKRTFQL